MICPACIANLALIAAGASSTGGLTMFAVKRVCGNFKQTTEEKGKKNETGSNRTQNKTEPNESPGDGVGSGMARRA
jgi:hypothetical protein